MQNKDLLAEFELSLQKIDDVRKENNHIYALVLESIQEKVSLTNPERDVWSFSLDYFSDGTIAYDAKVGEVYGSVYTVYTMPMVDFLMTLDEYKAKIIKEKVAKEQEKLQKA